MKITPIRTPKILPGTMSVEQLLAASISELRDSSIVVITSKVVSLCENQVVPIEGTDRNQLIRRNAQWYLDPSTIGEDYQYNFTITQNTLIPASGIDASNGHGNYVLWPQDPHESAGLMRQYLQKRFSQKHVGVIITDSAISLSRWGTLGIAIGHSGFSATRNYIGQPDLFGRPLTRSQANVAGGLAAAAVVEMGEGAEQTPMALIEDLVGVEFRDRDTSSEEISAYYLSPLDDEPFKPIFAATNWRPGGRSGR